VEGKEEIEKVGIRYLSGIEGNTNGFGVCKLDSLLELLE